VWFLLRPSDITVTLLARTKRLYLLGLGTAALTGVPPPPQVTRSSLGNAQRRPHHDHRGRSAGRVSSFTLFSLTSRPPLGAVGPLSTCYPQNFLGFSAASSTAKIPDLGSYAFYRPLLCYSWEADRQQPSAGLPARVPRRHVTGARCRLGPLLTGLPYVHRETNAGH
jgi:hypothetical protein